jgi:hypothetical protein
MVMDILQQVDHTHKIKQEKKQESISLKEQFKGCFPRDLNALLYAIFILVYLVCAIIHFAHTGEVTMLTMLLPYLSAYAGIQKVAHLLPWSKDDKQQN